MKLACISIILSYLLVQVTALNLVYPQDDDFYTPPSGYESKENGAILKKRQVEVGSFLGNIQVKLAWQYLVKSTSAAGDASPIVTTVMEPYNGDPNKLWSYNVAEDSNNVKCAPSFGTTEGPIQVYIDGNEGPQAELLIMNVGLSKGWYVNMPDHEGPNSAFPLQLRAARATLDSIKAALQSGDETGLSSDAKVIMFGYSGGSAGVGKAAEIAADYAPELSDNIIGATVGGWLTNITAIALTIDGTIFSGFIPEAVNGFLNEFSSDPDFKEYADSQLMPGRSAAFYAINNNCAPFNLVVYTLQTYLSGAFRWFKDGVGCFSWPKLKAVLDASTVNLNETTPVPDFPIFVYNGMLDEIMDFSENAERVYNAWCAKGAKSIEFAADESTGHITEIVAGYPAAIAWTEKIFGGGSAVEGCERTNRVSNLLYPGVEQSVVDIVKSLVSYIVGINVGSNPGPNGENISLLQIQAGIDVPASVSAAVESASLSTSSISIIPSAEAEYSRSLDTSAVDIASSILASVTDAAVTLA